MEEKKNCRTGTLTFHKSLNYGSFLQAYALQQKLMAMGCDTEIIDFEPNGFQKLYQDFLMPTNLWNLSYDCIHLLLWKYVKARKKSFRYASEKLLKISAEKYDFQTGLSAASDHYDRIICGSDQIWNSNARDFDINYMLQGVGNVYKAAYAVSINKGRYEQHPQDREIRACINDFDQLSVRETAGKEYLDGYLNGEKNVDVMIDPTFLLPMETYDKLAGERRIKEPYIFLFSIHFKDHVREAARNLSWKLNVPVYTLFSGRGTKNSVKARNEFHMLDEDVGPECFLNLMKYADYAVVDSFHGTAFSVIFRKKFIAVYDEQKDIRLNHILSMLKLEDRYMQPGSVQGFHTDSAVDYTAAEMILKEQIAKSEEFLNSVLEGIK